MNFNKIIEGKLIAVYQKENTLAQAKKLNVNNKNPTIKELIL